jgi:preprotein translocase SecE subunit
MNKKFGAIAVFMVVAVLLSVFTVSVYATDAATTTELPATSAAPETTAGGTEAPGSSQTPDGSTTTAKPSTTTAPGTTAATKTEEAKPMPLHVIVCLVVLGAVIVAVVVVAFGLPKNREKTLKLARSVKSESKKVSWYSWKNTRKATIVVLVCVIALAVIIGLLDYLFGQVFVKLIPSIF